MDANPGSVENNALLININSPPGQNKVARIRRGKGQATGRREATGQPARVRLITQGPEGRKINESKENKYSALVIRGLMKPRAS